MFVYVGGCSWLFPVGEWQVRGEVSVSRGHSGVNVRSDPGQLLLNEFLNSLHLLRTGAVLKSWVGFEGDFRGTDYGLKLFCGHSPKLHRDHRVHLPMTLQDGDVLVAASARRLWEGLVER